MQPPSQTKCQWAKYWYPAIAVCVMIDEAGFCVQSDYGWGWLGANQPVNQLNRQNGAQKHKVSSVFIFKESFLSWL